MNPVIERILTLWRELPLARKIAIGVVVMVILAGFTTMFIWANKTQFNVAYTGLSKEDAAAVVVKLKENNTPYRIGGDGNTIMVPEQMVYDVRLTLAQDGIPKGGGVGFEIFDKTEFGTTEFVQKINKKRAIQGELARTIMAFDEVKNARVMIVLPKDSVFVEEVKKPSASILLELNTDLDKAKVTSIAHLVASSIQDLTPELVTIVDTAGRILFEGKSEAEMAKIEAQNLADAQYQYKVRFEENVARRIQTMLERIVGKDKAIVRVTAEMDFSKNDMNEEIYDPFERGGEFVRSRKNRAEKVSRDVDETPIPSSVNPIVGDELTGQQGNELVDKSDDTVNYEISRRFRETKKPMAVLNRLSVAAVVDGTYEIKTDENGVKRRVFVPRSDDYMKDVREIVVKAMGYNEERSDQVSAECFPFASISEIIEEAPVLPQWKVVQKEYGRSIANLLLVLLLFLFIIRPIIKTVKEIKTTVETEELPGPDELAMLEEEKEPDFIDMDAKQQKDYLDMMTPTQKTEFIKNMTAAEKASYLLNMSTVEKAQYYAEKDFFKTINIVKGWATDYEE